VPGAEPIIAPPVETLVLAGAVLVGPSFPDTDLQQPPSAMRSVLIRCGSGRPFDGTNGHQTRGGASSVAQITR
jgi:hypothetical protein